MSDAIAALGRDALSEAGRSGLSRYLLGITGPPGAGKSTLVEALVRVCRAELGMHHVSALPMDGFHMTNEQLAALGLLDRKGAADTFDAHQFVLALTRLAAPAASPMTWPSYSRRLHEPIADAITIPSETQLVFIDGNYLLLRDAPWNGVKGILGLVWYLEADIETIRARLYRRHRMAGKTTAEANRRVRSDLVNAVQIEATKDRADRVVRVSPRDPCLTGLKDPATGYRVMCS
jgi:pantothenate kinase